MVGFILEVESMDGYDTVREYSQARMNLVMGMAILLDF
jgi:hypothetical protein